MLGETTLLELAQFVQLNGETVRVALARFRRDGLVAAIPGERVNDSWRYRLTNGVGLPDVEQVSDIPGPGEVPVRRREQGTVPAEVQARSDWQGWLNR